MNHDDICIIGAGPAGLSTALCLSRMNIKCTIIEKYKFPREKICGDGYTDWTVSNLRRIKPELADKFLLHPKTHVVSGVSVLIGRKNEIDVDFSDPEIPLRLKMYTMPRSDFDNILMEEAIASPNIKVLMPKTIIDVKHHEENVELITDQSESIFAKLIIYATGENSTLLKDFNEQYRKTIICIRAYFENLSIKQKNYVKIAVAKLINPGYFWMFPLQDDTYNVGLGLTLEKYKKINKSLTKVFDELIEQPKLKRIFQDSKQLTKFKASKISYLTKKAPISGDRFIVTGDASSFADSLSGEGIGNALACGYYAATVISEQVKSMDFSAEKLEAYDQLAYKNRFDEMQQSLRIMGFLKHWPLIRWGGWNLKNNRRLLFKLIRASNDIKERHFFSNPISFLKFPFTKD